MQISMHIKTIIMQRFPRLRASGLGIKLLGPIMFDIPVVTDSTLKRSCFVEITAKIILSKCYEPTLTNQAICTQCTSSNIIILIKFVSKPTLSSITLVMFSCPEQLNR